MDTPSTPAPVSMSDVLAMLLHAVIRSDARRIENEQPTLWHITSIRPNTFEIKARHTNQKFTVTVEEST